MRKLYVGLDVSKNETAICVRDDIGGVVLATKVITDPGAIMQAFKTVDGEIARIVMETGRASNWLYAGLLAQEMPVVCVDARQAHAILSQMHNKTDANDAAMLAELARTGFYRAISVKSMASQRMRALLRAREVAMKARMNVENTIRGLLASFGIQIAKEHKTFAMRVLSAIEDDNTVSDIVRPLVHLRADILRGLAALDRQLRTYVRNDATCRRLMTAPGIGAISAFAFVATVDDPARFRRSRSVGAYIGLTARRHQSGALDISGRISRRGDTLLRTVLYEAANSLLTRARAGNGAQLKEWAQALKARIGHKKAVVALARKLAVLLHRLWVDGTEFQAMEQAA